MPYFGWWQIGVAGAVRALGESGFRRVFVVGLIMLLAPGCTRSYYRNYADEDVYGIFRERLVDWRWRLPSRAVEADPRTRMAVRFDPDREPIPPDEPVARKFQVSSRFPFEYHGWKKRGVAPIEDLSWQKNIPVESDGKVLLGRDSIMRLGIMNSRDYQFNFENLYLTALSLTLARFQFMVQGFSNNTLFYQVFGYGADTQNDQLQLNSSNGFNLEFMSGAQLLVDMANTIVFQYSGGKQVELVTPNLALGFTQPLLRGAWARIVTQQLSLQERQMLYAVRSFAEYRRQFYVNLVAQSGYLGLLYQLQTIRNQQSNLDSFKESVALYQEEVISGLKTPLELDQLLQQYQGTQVSLLSSQAGLQQNLDAFKIQLGLPPELEVRIDDSPLKTFELYNPRLDVLRDEATAYSRPVFQALADSKPVIRSTLAKILEKLRRDYPELSKIHREVYGELDDWVTRLGAARQQGFKGADADNQKDLYERQVKLAQQIRATLDECAGEMAQNREAIATLLLELDTMPEAGTEDATRRIDDLIRKEFRARVSEVYVAQTQIRVYRIPLTPVELTVNQAIQIALGNRLDLMNAEATVTDTWRNVEVTANALKGVLNFVYKGNLNAAPDHTTLFRFDSSNSTQRFGFEFDAPINRRAERNAYRTAQITYQRARRAYMLTRDTVVQQIRQDMRQLVLSKRQFEINREQLITTSRLVEQAEYAVQNPLDATSPSTLNLIQALQSLLTARNALILNWVSYETARMSLYRDFDLMDIDANGMWTNENDPTAITIALRRALESPTPVLSIPAGIPDLSPDATSDSVFYEDTAPGGRPEPVPDRLNRTDETDGPLTPRELREDAPEGGIDPNKPEGRGILEPATPRPAPPPGNVPGPFGGRMAPNPE
jgi:outer membrane protein TolC